jgi:hypothetical protein
VIERLVKKAEFDMLSLSEKGGVVSKTSGAYDDIDVDRWTVFEGYDMVF